MSMMMPPTLIKAFKRDVVLPLSVMPSAWPSFVDREVIAAGEDRNSVLLN